MEQYTCLVCGYVYDPVHGDPDQGIKPGTSFDDLPDDWECPVCASPVMDFQKIDSLSFQMLFFYKGFSTKVFLQRFF